VDYYIDKFERVVDLLRYTGNYTATLVLGTQYTIVSDVNTYLSVGDYLTLGLVKARVLSIVDAKNFTVDSINTAVDGSGVWKALAPYSMFGTRKTINYELTAKNGNEFKYQKYPVIALRLPAPVVTDGGVATLQANILIATFTSKTQRPSERVVNTFRPILNPLVDRFLEMCRRSGEFLMFNPDHEQIDRMFYGTGGDEEDIANVFDDPLDAVELRNLELRFLIEDCP
jgi:hypothetical protein